MSEATLHKGTTKLTESENMRKKRKFKLLMRYMYLTFEVCNDCYLAVCNDCSALAIEVCNDCSALADKIKTIVSDKVNYRETKS